MIYTREWAIRATCDFVVVELPDGSGRAVWLIVEVYRVDLWGCLREQGRKVKAESWLVFRSASSDACKAIEEGGRTLRVFSLKPCRPKCSASSVGFGKPGKLYCQPAEL